MPVIVVLFVFYGVFLSIKSPNCFYRCLNESIYWFRIRAKSFNDFLLIFFKKIISYFPIFTFFTVFGAIICSFYNLSQWGYFQLALTECTEEPVWRLHRIAYSFNYCASNFIRSYFCVKMWFFYVVWHIYENQRSWLLARLFNLIYFLISVYC